MYRVAWCWPMRPMEMITASVRSWKTLGLPYVVGIQSSTSVWPPRRRSASAPGPRLQPGALPVFCGRDKHHQPLSVKELALCLSLGDWRRVSWRVKVRVAPCTRVLLCLRVRVALRDYWRSEPHPEQWLLIEWPKTEKEPTKYWLSNLPESSPLRQLVALGTQRWSIERDYQELKKEQGTWSGPFRRTRAGAAFITMPRSPSQPTASWVQERCLFPPPPGSPPMRAANLRLRLPHVQSSYAPRGALRRCEPNGIIPARSPPFGARLQPTWPAPCPDDPAACEIS